MTEMNILITSVGRRSYLVDYFKKALNGLGKVHVSNSTDITPAFQRADEAVITPKIYNEAYIPFLLQYCKTNRINVIISLFDIDLFVLAANRSVFEEHGIKVIVSDKETIEICNDKYKTYCYLRERGFLVPKTFLSVEEALSAMKKNELSYPLIIKPRWGMGSISVFQADNDEELKVFFNKVKRQVFESYLKYESSMDRENCVIIQEKLNGQEFGLDIINDLNKSYVNTIVKKKLAMRSGETDCAITVNELDMKNLGEKLSKTVLHIANLDVDVFECDGKIYILEMNARFGGGYPFSHLSGVDLPKMIIKWLNEEDIDDSLYTETFDVMGHKDINISRIITKPNNTLA